MIVIHLNLFFTLNDEQRDEKRNENRNENRNEQ
jgi:hypothetical protein